MKAKKVKISIIVAGLLLLGIIPVYAYVKLEVPYTAQAPEGDWSEPWQNACEETSIAMVDYFYADKEFTTASAKQEILKIIRLRQSVVGNTLDESAATVVKIINFFMPWEAYIHNNPTIDEIKEQIDLEQPVIIPAHGATLANEHFKNPYLDYHMFVIIGYDDMAGQFIVQEPGTSWGLNYRYDYDTVISAMHDIDPSGNTALSSKVAIFTRKELIDTFDWDLDYDGLTKEEELAYGTVLWLSDSDGDGFSDGTEVEMGYSPTLNELKTARDGSLIKTIDSPHVYLIQGKLRRRVANEQVFLSHGWRWSDIITVSWSYLNRFDRAADVTN